MVVSIREADYEHMQQCNNNSYNKIATSALVMICGQQPSLMCEAYVFLVASRGATIPYRCKHSWRCLGHVR